MTSPDQTYQIPDDLPASLPVFPLSNVLLLPRGQLPLNIFEPRYLEMVNSAWESDRLIGMIQPANQADAALLQNANASPELARVGCVGRITSYAKTEGGQLIITLTGIARFKVVKELKSPYPYRICQIDSAAFEDDFTPRSGEELVDRQALTLALKSFLETNNLEADWEVINQSSTEAVVNMLSIMSPYDAIEKQALLEAPSLQARAEMLLALHQMAQSQNTAKTKPTLQ